jgi:hypothetical protein
LFSSPSLVCVETAAALMHALKIKTLNVRDELADVLMKSWYSEDPFLGWSNKLTTNK